jgi:DNA repair exonuclease SbcCD ATPase subunit|tara:strand:- start:319 stop:807 length:489 start_codon:yes stop_codon:yes gene_type:complete
MIAETLAGIALVKSAVDGIKSAIGTAQDISEIAGHIDNLFEGESQVQKARNKKSGVDQFNIKSVAQETIDARIAQEKLYEMSQMIDMRFGHGTWQGIVTERAKRIQEAKEAALAARKKKAKEQAELVENIKMGAIIFGAIAAIIAAAVGMIISAAKAVGINQ